ncbi:MAG: XdhC family protein, partial [Desulfobacterales bacterium]|nr:XdhC family protein [Desulfobacterales bacterium]
MAHLTDFLTVVVDDREEFANPERFPDSKTVHVVKKFDTAFDSLSIDESSYIVILTRGHLHDETVLEAALKTDAAYIGMIGSRTKRNQIYTNLREKGIADKALESVFSPIGLEIHAETPAEIAVSIMGEIIKIRAEK